MRLERWGDVWVFRDTSSQTAVRLRNPVTSERRGLFAFKGERPAGRAQKRRPIVGDALLQEPATPTTLEVELHSELHGSTLAIG